MIDRSRVEIAAQLVHETAAAYLLDTGEVDKNKKPKPIWVPKSLCEKSEDAKDEWHIAEWFAKDKGLI